jgi:glucose-6-phosphate dehydrogenase assembly protein OpcA
MEDPVTTSDLAPPPVDNLPLDQVEGALARLLHSVKEPGEAPAQRAQMSNLVVFCDRAAQAEAIAAQVPDIVAAHPARVLLLLAEHGTEPGDLTAAVRVWCQLGPGRQPICSEQVTLHARGQAVERLSFAMRELLIGDLPTNLWWAPPEPPPMAGGLLFELTEQAQQIIYDSIGWLEPARGVAATASWLSLFEHVPPGGRWCVISDLNWRRLKYWRRLLGQALDPASAPGALESITEVLVEHGPHAVIQAWELVSWLAARLGWRVQAGRVRPGVEITWQFTAPHGVLSVRIRRLAEGPPEVRRVRIACALDGKPAALNVVVQDERRLAVLPEGVEAAPRTLVIQPQPLAGLVSRQLSDRELDPVFRESMAVAQVLAQSLLG